MTSTGRLEDLWERRWQASSGEPGVFGDKRGSSISQDFMETEPLCLLIVLLRSAGSKGMDKNNRLVSFPSRLEFLRTGAYDFAGAFFHRGDSTTSGHYTAACALRRDGEWDYAYFDDAKPPVLKKWEFLENAKQMAQAYVLLYTRSSYVPVQDSHRLPRELPYAVGLGTQSFLQERLRVAEAAEALADRVTANKAVASQRRAAKRRRLDAGLHQSWWSLIPSLQRA